MEIIALLCIAIALGLLILLSIIDLRTYLLPNIYVAPFAILGVIFHIATGFYYLSLNEMLLGGAAGFGVLYLIRMAGNKYYGQDSLGLGDVKLLGAGGLWLGVEGVLFAMTMGACFGLIHGLLFGLYKKLTTKGEFSIRRLAIPAGPGFAVGIIIMATWMYKGFVIASFYELLP